MNSSFGRSATLFAGGIAALYAVIGVAWILVSDHLVLALSPNTDWLVLAQRYKGLGYIGLTSVALGLLVRTGYMSLLRAQARVQQGELQVQELFVNHPKPMWVYDPQTLHFLSVNHAATQAYGYSEAEFLAMSIKDIRPPQDVVQLLRVLSKPSTGLQDSGVHRHRRRDGAVFCAHITSHAVSFRGRPARLVMADDVTEELLARDAVQRQEAQFRQLHDSLQAVLWLASPDAEQVLYVSPAFEHLYGRPGGDLLRDAALWMRCVHPQDVSIALQAERELGESGASVCEYRIVRPDAGVRWVCDRRRRIVDAAGEVLMVGGSVEDVTDHKSAALLQQEMNERLEERVVARTQELRFVNQELEAFARTVAHDLKAPLNAISGFIQILRLRHGAALGSDGDRTAQHIDTSARAMAHLVDDLLVLSRVTTHALQLQPVDLSRTARQVIDELRSREPERSVSVLIPDLPTAHADPGLIRALLTNLLGNAWKYSAKQAAAVIEMGVRASEDGPIYHVRDNGAGFDIKQAGRLFKPFQRFHSASEFAGTGVGLATCQRIVRRHGGLIWVTSTPGQGTTVYFTLAALSEGEQRALVQPDSYFATLD